MTTYRHGMKGTSFYKIWRGMKDRCTNKNSPAYANYGGRGIKICDNWLKFDNFYTDMYPTFIEGLTIDRMNNEDGYYKENCQWIPRAEQMRNKRNTKYVEYRGETYRLPALAKKLGMKYTTLYNRIYVYKLPIG